MGTGDAPTPVLLSIQSQFPTDDSNGYITGLAVDEAKGIIYFTTNGSAEGVNTSQDGIWWMPIAGGTATKMTIPAGVEVKYPVFYGNALTLDVESQDLYYSDKQTGEIVKFTLSADGQSFTAASNFAAIDADGGTDNDGGFANQILFNDLPQLTSVSGTSTQAVQGGSAVSLLAGSPSMTDPDGFDLSGATVTITGAQAGDVLAAATAGTSITASYSSSTHVLTLSGEDSYAHYVQVFNSVTYQDTGTDVSTGSHPTRTLTWIIGDGITVVHPSTSDPNEKQTVVTIDRPPEPASDTYNVQESGSSTGTSGQGGTGVLGNDIDRDADSISVTAVNGSAGNLGSSLAGTYGHLILNANGAFTYNADLTAAIDSAATGSHPSDSFTYTVGDGHGGSATQTVSFTINRPPTVVSDGVSALESGASATGNVLGNDSDKDNDALTISAVAGSGTNVNTAIAGTYGHLTLHSNGSYSYDADITSAIDGGATGAHLTDTFSYTADDGHGGTASTSFVITIDRAPTVVGDNPAGEALESGPAVTGDVLGNDGDDDADTLTVSAVAGSAGNVGNSLAGTYGHVTINANGGYSYLADNAAAIDGAATGSHLTDLFSYTADDGYDGTGTANLVVTIDRAPTVTNDGASLNEGANASANAVAGVLGNDSDRDDDALTVSTVNGSAGNVGVSTAGTYGHLTLNADGSYSYDADVTSAIDGATAGSHPIDTFTVAAGDDHGGTTNETLSFTINRTPSLGADFRQCRRRRQRLGERRGRRALER